MGRYALGSTVATELLSLAKLYDVTLWVYIVPTTNDILLSELECLLMR